MHASYYTQYPIPELIAESRGKKDANSIKYHEWLSAATGMDIGYEDLLKIGQRIINLERALNTRFGIRRKDDRLPKRFTQEKLKSGRAEGEIFDPEILEKMLDEYYDKRGWDRESGLLKRSALVKLGMSDVANRLKKENLLASRPGKAKKKGKVAQGKGKRKGKTRSKRRRR
jgi:aldehyde:ferredoxin oxidoreductase